VSQEEFDRAQAMTPRGARAGVREEPDVRRPPVEIPKDLSELSDKELLELANPARRRRGRRHVRDVLVAAVAAAPGGHERPQQ
jgi:hypothetical protein